MQLGQGSGLDQLASFQTIGQSLQSLALQYPGIVQSPNFQQAGLNLTQVSTIAAQISAAQPADLPAIVSPTCKALFMKWLIILMDWSVSSSWKPIRHSPFIFRIPISPLIKQLPESILCLAATHIQQTPSIRLPGSGKQ